MVEVTFDTKSNIIQCRLSGVVSAEDYEKVLIPAITKHFEKNKTLKVLYYVDENFDSYELKAMYDDAKIGMKFFFQWEKIAVVSDVEWLKNSVRLFSFLFPATIETFATNELKQAKEWLEQTKQPTLEITLDEQNDIVVFQPHDKLSKEDFDYAKEVIEPFIEKNTTLKGLVIYTKDFSGWDSFTALLRHLEFIKKHHKKVQKLAFVTDAFIGEFAEKIGAHFVNAKVEHFNYEDLNKAKEWILS